MLVLTGGTAVSEELLPEVLDLGPTAARNHGPCDLCRLRGWTSVKMDNASYREDSSIKRENRTMPTGLLMKLDT
eukprot:1488997-Amphidinium_carterae.2